MPRLSRQRCRRAPRDVVRQCRTRRYRPVYLVDTGRYSGTDRYISTVTRGASPAATSPIPICLSPMPNPRPADPRERIERAAYELFSQHGTRAVGVDALAERAGVAKMTLYRHYPSKDELVLAFLRRREELWTRSWLEGVVRDHRRAPAERLLAIFDLFDGWFRRPGFEACSFTKVLLEHGDPKHPARA